MRGLLYKPPASDDPPLLCSSPLTLVCYCRTEESAGWSKYFTFTDPDGREQFVVVGFADLAGDGAAIRALFAERGLIIAGKRIAREKFVEAVCGWSSPVRAWCQAAVGWGGNGGTFALPGQTFSADDETQVVFRGAGGQAPFAQAGTLEDWQRWVRKLVTGHDFPTFFLALALTGPTLDILGLPGFGVNAWGPSSSGKTITLKVGASVWGGRSFVRTFRGTANSFESIAEMHSDAFLPIDEMNQASGADVGNVVFMLSQGVGKTRARSDSELKASKHFRACYGTTNEGTTANKIEEDGRTLAKAGQTNRLVDLAVSGVSGVFADAGKSKAELAALANEIDAATKTIYGSAGPAFVEDLVKNREGCAIDLQRLGKDFRDRFIPADSDGQIHRVAANFAAVSAAGELAILLKILPFPMGTIRAATGRLFQQWIAARGGTGASEDRQAVIAIKVFIEAHHRARFVDLKNDGSWRIQFSAGYKSDEDFYLNDGAWKEALKGLDPRNAADALTRQGYLIRDQSENRRKTRKRIGTRTEWLYRVPVSILAFDDVH